MGDTPQFSEPLLLGFLSNFCIPKTFLKHLGLGKSNTGDNCAVVLKDKLSSCADDGEQKTWRVTLDSDGMRFLDGWREFADDHSLHVGKFLVFYYIGRFMFEVSVFDSVSDYAQSLSAVETRDVEFSEENSTHSLSVEKTGDVEFGEKKCTCTCERAGFKPSKHPYFRTDVKQYCFKWHAMLIPTQFARLHNLAKRWCEMKLIDQESREWTINLRHRKSGKDQVYLASGWDAFSIANKLKVEDSVVFELIESGSEPVMKFYKLRCDQQCGTEGEGNKT